MPRAPSILPAARDKVKCSKCNRTIERRCINSHWNQYQKRLPIHPKATAYTDRYEEIRPVWTITKYLCTQQLPQNVNDDQKNMVRFWIICLKNLM